KQLLLAAAVGEGILFAGPHHAPIRIVASPEEYQFVTTKPQDIVAQQKSDQQTQQVLPEQKPVFQQQQPQQQEGPQTTLTPAEAATIAKSNF
ncbi:MAG: hypothetical protein COU68_01720, partial [Candidatus Pacebacteria bacterium CG10_big_fil_rev_8_21_14_0_10_45_6]